MKGKLIYNWSELLTEVIVVKEVYFL